MSFKVGQKVVCIDNETWEVGSGPKRGDDITIRDIHINPFGIRGVFLLFREFPESPGWNPAYHSKFFRPIDYSFGEKKCAEIIEICEHETKRELV